nr:1-(5-phosphoribosyl)-5-[(5-phosphoribosylamino)methylideneamino]imidazole-4-carboxamide isomerase [uncultured Cellulosilyticum sp.]
MKLYPAIDLKDGQCVRLLQGDYNEVTVYGKNPAEMAKKWERLGGAYLHIVDLDGAKAGESKNAKAVAEIVDAIQIPIELGGGIRNIAQIKAQLDCGVDRVILGSAAIKNRALVKEAIETFGPERIVVGVDAKNGQVAIEGWLEVTNTSALDFCKELEVMGVKTVIYTDISKDGMMQGPNIEETKKLVDETNLQIIASGGVSCMADLERLEQIHVHGAIIGKAIYIGAIDLEEAAKRFS